MNPKPIELIASVIGDFLKLPALNCRELVQQLLNMKCEDFLLRGAFIDQLAMAGILLHTEDLPLVFDWYGELERLLVANEPYEHHGFFTDGVLTTEAHSNREIVNFKLEYCPKLDKANLVTFTTNLTETEYVQWWRSIVHQVLATANRE
jgi:hypothetical protein